MARKGENIYYRKDGRWEGRYIIDHSESGKPEFGYIYADTYKKAKEKLARAKLKGKKTVHTFECMKKYFEDWLMLCKIRVQPSTYAKYKTVSEKYLIPAFGSFAPDEITSRQTENFGIKLSQTLSPKTVKDILSVFNSVLKYVSERSVNALNVKNVKITYPKEKKKEMRVLTYSEQERLTRFLLKKTDNFKFGILLALFTGMRIGEICALKWEDISFEEAVINVRHSVQRLPTETGDGKKTKAVIGNTKSDSSLRVIPLTEFTLGLCKKMRPKNGKGYILTGNETKFSEPRVMQYRLKQYLCECNIKDVHFHTLRHTFATRCVEAGFEIKTLSEVLGHSNTSITLERYVHSSLELKRANMEKLKVSNF